SKLRGLAVLVAVCGTSSRLTQVTLVPGATVNCLGRKLKLSTVTRLGTSAGSDLPLAAGGSWGAQAAAATPATCAGPAPSAPLLFPAQPSAITARTPGGTRASQVLHKRVPPNRRLRFGFAELG